MKKRRKKITSGAIVFVIAVLLPFLIIIPLIFSGGGETKIKAPGSI